MKILLFNWNGILDEVAEELSKEHEVAVSNVNHGGWEKFDTLVFWSELEEHGWKKLIQKAKKAGKKTVLVQHGRRGISRFYPPFNEGVICDLVCCWGEWDKKRLMDCGIEESRIRVTGSPLFNKLKPRIEHSGKNVVFSAERWIDPVPENPIVAAQIRKLDNVKIITKCLTEHLSENYDNPVISDINEPDHLDKIAEVLSITDVVVGISESTFCFLAEYLDIPVVIADIWIPKAGGKDERYKQFNKIYSNACFREKDIFKLNEAIKFALKHPEHLREERKRVVIEEGGANIKDPVKELVKAILE